MILTLIAFVVLIAINGLFVAAEFALISARKDRLQTLADQGSKSASEVIAIGNRLPALITGAQLGVTLASLVLGWIAEPMFATVVSSLAHLVHVPDFLIHPLALILSLTMVAFLHVLFGEMVPKNLALSGPERAAMLLSGLLVLWVRMTAPLTWAFQKTASGLVRVLGVEPKEEFDSAVSVAELGAMISESRKVGLLDEEEHRRLTRLLTSGDRTISEVAIPLPQIVTLNSRVSPEGEELGPTAIHIEEAVARTGFSRFPVLSTLPESDSSRPRNRVEDFLGYVHLKDALPLMTSDVTMADQLGPQMRELPQVLATLNLDDALAALMKESSQLALVVHEEGHVVGLASLEDLVRGLMDGPRNVLNRAD